MNVKTMTLVELIKAYSRAQSSFCATGAQVDSPWSAEMNEIIKEAEQRVWAPTWDKYPSWVNYVVSYPGGQFVKFLEEEPASDGEWRSGRWCWQRIEHENVPQIFTKPEGKSQ